MSDFEGYDKQYLDEYDRRAQTDLGRRIIDCRWETVQSFIKYGTLLDYGCATGAFHTAAPVAFEATGWDVNPYSEWYTKPPRGHWDVLTMWDVIEHLGAPYYPLDCYTPTWVFISTPNAANTSLWTFKQWKHYKPVEHIHYFTLRTLTMGMAANGYDMVHYDYDEGRLRDAENPKAILTAVFRCSKPIR